MKQINSLGRKCPHPILDLAKALKESLDEDHFVLHSDDVATWSDLRAWSRMTGHTVEMIAPLEFSIHRKTD